MWFATFPLISQILIHTASLQSPASLQAQGALGLTKAPWCMAAPGRVSAHHQNPHRGARLPRVRHLSCGSPKRRRPGQPTQHLPSHDCHWTPPTSCDRQREGIVIGGGPVVTWRLSLAWEGAQWTLQTDILTLFLRWLISIQCLMVLVSPGITVEVRCLLLLLRQRNRQEVNPLWGHW